MSAKTRRASSVSSSPNSAKQTKPPCAPSLSSTVCTTITPEMTPPCGVNVHLRQHQQRLVQRLLDPSAHMPHRQLFVAPTGSGKTIAGIVAGVCMIQRGIVKGVHVVVPKSIVHQFEQEIDRLVPLHLAPTFSVHTHAAYFRQYNRTAASAHPSRSVENNLLIIDEAHSFCTEVSVSLSQPFTSSTQATPTPTTTRSSRKQRTSSMPLLSSTCKRSQHAQKGQRGARAFSAICAAHRAKAVLLMTATPLLNGPMDLMNLLCMVCGYTLPDFYRHPHVACAHKTLSKAQKLFLLHGNRCSLRQALQSPAVYMFVKWMSSKIVFASRTSEGLPSVTDQTVTLTMGPEYLKLYNAVECNKLTEFHNQLQKRHAQQQATVRTTARVHKPENPVRKCDSQNPRLVSPLRCVFQPEGVDAFYMKLRQLVNGVTRRVVSGKVEYATEVAVRGHAEHRRVVVYSNFLDGGVSLVAHQLQAPKKQLRTPVPFVQIVGNSTQKQRQEAVRALNSGEVYVMLLSRAGCEGLDLKGVRDVVLLEPHFHNERLRQVIGRAIRYRSHEALPAPERKVTIHRLLLQKPANNNATWAEAERHNEKQIRKLLDTYRVRAYEDTLALTMNVPNKLLFNNIRQTVWQDKLSHAHTLTAMSASGRAKLRAPLPDPFDRVKVDTTTLDPTDFNLYVHFTDRMVEQDEWAEDGLGMSSLFAGGHATTPERVTATSSSSDEKKPFTYDDIFHLRNVPMDLSVDDIVQRLAERKETLNQQFLQLFKRMAPP